jgi:hypothetical protein
MEGTPEPQTNQLSEDLVTPQPSKRFQVGDRVQVFQGTGPGVPGKKTIQFIGIVVGYNTEKERWKVRDIMVSKRGHPSEVAEQFMSR